MKTQYERALIVVALAVPIHLLALRHVAAQDMGRIDPITANEVMPDAQMSQDVWNDKPTLRISGWTRVEEWQGYFTSAEIRKIAPTGFYAAIYKGANGSITIAYRSTKGWKEWGGTNIPAAEAQTPVQYESAQRLAEMVKAKYPNATISVTGHSLGGGLAAYAAQQVLGIANVTTFNAPRPPIVSTTIHGGVNERNVIVRGDFVGDPKNSTSGLNFGSLPGKTYEVNSTTYTLRGKRAHFEGRWIPQEQDSHSIAGIIGGLRIAESSSSSLNLKDITTSAGRTYASTGTRNGTSGPLATRPSSADPNVLAGGASPDRHTKTSSSTGIAASSSHSSPLQPQRTTPEPAAIQPRAPAPVIASVTPLVRNVPVTAPRQFAMARPGGISLSSAAAEAMPIRIDLDGVYYHDGKLAVSGRESRGQTFDAALMLTAFRTACDVGDPYFSLDPDNAVAWSDETERASEKLWERVSKDVNWGAPVKADRRTVNANSLMVRNIWARRDYPQVWNDIAAKYPNLQSRLVFRPTWLQQTRFGEILYKADVLLKELSSGVSVLEPGALRAAKIDGYVSQLARSNAKNLLLGMHHEHVQREWRGSRFWFDITPGEINQETSNVLAIRSASDRTLADTLRKHKLLADWRPSQGLAHQVIRDGEALDLSSVYPTMFVRRRDIARGVDIPDGDSIMNSFSTHVNNNIEKYVNSYKELQALTSLIRAYVVAVHVVRNQSKICDRLRDTPLFDAEKTARSLPTHQPTELAISVERYAYGTGRAVRTLFARAMVVQGGVTIAGKHFYESSAIDMETRVISELRREVSASGSQAPTKAVWTGGSGRQFILLDLTAEEGPQQVDSFPARFEQGHAAGSMRRTPNKYFRAESYKSFTGSSFPKCEEICLKEPECVAVDFERVNNRCQLFDKFGDAEPHATTSVAIKERDVHH